MSKIESYQYLKKNTIPCDEYLFHVQFLKLTEQLFTNLMAKSYIWSKLRFALQQGNSASAPLMLLTG